MTQNPKNSARGFSEPSAPHEVTKLIRDLLETSIEYTRFMQDSLDVNETDFKAMEALMEQGAMTAGALAKEVGISAGAATTMIDRLEALGHVTRQSNPNDRRGVVVVPNQNSVETAWGHLQPIIATSESSIRRMAPKEQEAVRNYLRDMVEVFSRK